MKYYKDNREDIDNYITKEVNQYLKEVNKLQQEEKIPNINIDRKSVV